MLNLWLNPNQYYCRDKFFNFLIKGSYIKIHALLDPTGGMSMYEKHRDNAWIKRRGYLRDTMQAVNRERVYHDWSPRRVCLFKEVRKHSSQRLELGIYWCVFAELNVWIENSDLVRLEINTQCHPMFFLSKLNGMYP